MLARRRPLHHPPSLRYAGWSPTPASGFAKAMPDMEAVEETHAARRDLAASATLQSLAGVLILSVESENRPMSIDAEFQALRTCPAVAWPTVALFAACAGIIGGVWYLGINDAIPLWAGAVINGITSYFLFSVVHDASHNALSRNKLLNEALGRIGLVYFAPLAPMDVARFIHMAHHRHANDPARDPDAYSHKLDWLFPIRWANFDYFYAKWFFTKGGEFARRKYLPVAAYVAAIVAGASTIVYLGYGSQLLWLWIIPTRISSFLFVFVFSYLTHQPFETLAQENEYKATALRLGADWFWSPVMANHNYHLLHHLYPSAPFYVYQRMWKLKGEEILREKPLMPPTWGLSPRRNPGH